MKSKFYISLISVMFALVFQNCQENSIEKSLPPDELIARISVAEEEKLLKGLDYLQAKTPVGARVNQSKIDKLRLDSVIRRIDPKTGSTNYSFFVEESRPYSLTNLVITENKGAYLAFFVEYISANPKAGWNLVQFQGKVKLTSIDGKVWKIATIAPSATSGRTDGWSCSNSVTKITKSWSGGSSSYFETEYACSFIESNDFGDISDSGNNVTPGMTGINDNGVSPEPEYVVDGVTHGFDIPNLLDYLKCFTDRASAQVTIYVDQPLANSAEPYELTTGHVGHSWLSITQNGISRLIGFYPDGKAFPWSEAVRGKLKSDTDRTYDVSITFEFNSDQMAKALLFIRGSTPSYQVNDYNCTNYIVDLFSRLDISLPTTVGYWPLGHGLNPGNFGQDMRSYSAYHKSKDLNGGLPLDVVGECD